MKKVLVVFGTRPEAIKLAPVVRQLQDGGRLQPVVCVTAQHRQMLDQVLALFHIEPAHDLDLMREDQRLAALTAEVLTRIDDVLEGEAPDLVMVQGDTTTAMAAALAAYYRRIPIAHVEAGLRTGDRYNPFPEEANRIFVDHLAELCFAPTAAAKAHLLDEGIEPSRVYQTGNTVVDALMDVTSRLERPEAEPFLRELPNWLRETDWTPGCGHRLLLVTGHRRESFRGDLESVCSALRDIAARNSDVDIVYPVHPNPNVREPAFRVLQGTDRVHLLDPLSYVPFVWLMNHAYLVLTDSGGVQEEVASLGKPALVTRKATERPEGIMAGVASLVGVDSEAITTAVQRLLDDPAAYASMANVSNPYGDGHAAERIADITGDWLEGNSS